MKPRLIKVNGLWHCGIKGTKGHLGVGWSPDEAYRDWWWMLRKEWLK